MKKYNFRISLNLLMKTSCFCQFCHLTFVNVFNSLKKLKLKYNILMNILQKMCLKVEVPKQYSAQYNLMQMNLLKNL